jgi:hypothetical protein
MAFRIGRSRRGGRPMARRAINAMPRMARRRMLQRRTPRAFSTTPTSDRVAVLPRPGADASTLGTGGFAPNPSAPGINLTPDMAYGLPPGMTNNPTDRLQDYVPRPTQPPAFTPDMPMYRKPNVMAVLPRPGADASDLGAGGFTPIRDLPTPQALSNFKAALEQNPQALAKFQASLGQNPQSSLAQTPQGQEMLSLLSGLKQNSFGASGVTSRQMFKNGGVVKMAGGGLIGAASQLIDLGNAVSDELGYIAGGDTYLTSKYGSSTETGGGEGLTAPAGQVQEDNMFTDALMADGGEPLMAMQEQAMMAPPMPEQLPPGMPSPQEIGAQMGQAMGPEGLAAIEGGLAQAQASVEALDNAESPEDVINAIRGDQAPISARRAELASLVGEEDAAATPDSVLALVQPVLVMASQSEQGNIDQGIGALASEEMEAPVEGPMADGIMSMMS